MTTDASAPAWTEADLTKQLATDCAVRPGDILLVHSSMKSLGRVEGGPQAVVRALMAAVTEAGTILVPTYTSPQPDGVFHHASTPSRTGLITEAFRTMPGVVRSLHPTHSVSAWGRQAREFTDGHDRTSGLGAKSPFHKAALAGGQVLMIGCSMTSCSLVHVSEAIVRTPYFGVVFYPGYERTLTMALADGTRIEVPPKDNPTDSAGFTALQAELDRRRLITHCRLGAAACLKFSGRECLAVAVEMLKADPTALLCHNERCAVCPKARELCRPTGR